MHISALVIQNLYLIATLMSVILPNYSSRFERVKIHMLKSRANTINIRIDVPRFEIHVESEHSHNKVSNIGGKAKQQTLYGRYSDAGRLYRNG